MRSPPKTHGPADAALASRHWLKIHLKGGYSGKVRRRHRDNTMHRAVSRCRTRWWRVCQRGPVAERRPLPGVRARLLACDASRAGAWLHRAAPLERRDREKVNEAVRKLARDRN